MSDEWVTIEVFAERLGVDKAIVDHMVNANKVQTKEENNIILLKTVKDELLLPEVIKELATPENNELVSVAFAEKSIATILNLHDKVILAKDETIGMLSHENEFLKEISFSVQEIYETEKETIETLQEQLRLANEEIVFLKRKYKLMWNKAIENQT
jgi:hypothetical protein